MFDATPRAGGCLGRGTLLFSGNNVRHAEGADGNRNGISGFGMYAKIKGQEKSSNDQHKRLVPKGKMSADAVVQSLALQSHARKSDETSQDL